MADCNSTLYEVNYTNGVGESCDSFNKTLGEVCLASTDGTSCHGDLFPGTIIDYCIHFCASCPRFLYGMDHANRISFLEVPMGSPAHNNAVFFSVLLASLCGFGSVANVLTIVVILRNKVLQATPHYLVSLALSDLLMLMTTAPVEIKFQLSFWPWNFPQFFCRLHPYIKEACLYTTVLHIVAFTIERYIVICHPMRARIILSRSRATRVIIVIWICSFLLAAPIFAVHSVQEFCHGIAESSVCFPNVEQETFLAIFHGIGSIILFFVPMTLIIVLYSLIARALFAKKLTLGRRTSSMSMSSKVTTKPNIPINDAVDKARQHAVKLLALVAVFFFVLWFPFMWIRLRPLIFVDNLDEEAYHKWYYSISMSLLYLSSCTNPVLYNVMSARFRKAYKSTIMCRDVRSSKMPDRSMYSNPHSRTDSNLPSTHFTAF